MAEAPYTTIPNPDDKWPGQWDNKGLNAQAGLTPTVDAAPASRSAAFGQGASEKAEVYAVKNMTGAQRTAAHDEHVASLGDDGV